MKITINQVQPLSGGDINLAYRLTSEDHNYFLKLNTTDRIPDLFETEAFGLELLSRSCPLRVPTPLHYGHLGPALFLVLEWIEKGDPTAKFWEIFARGLAALHRTTEGYFGLSQDNYIGSIPQPNQRCLSWSEFYWSRRLEPLIQKAFDLGRIGTKGVRMGEKLAHVLPEIFPAEPPALLHGDLWAGNFQCDPEGKPCLYDPAVYFGHREMDLAMSLLFGGFDRNFYAHYREIHPLEPDWEKRVGICQLYPLLVHSILFGGSYIHQVEEILEAFRDR